MKDVTDIVLTKQNFNGTSTLVPGVQCSTELWLAPLSWLLISVPKQGGGRGGGIHDELPFRGELLF